MSLDAKPFRDAVKARLEANFTNTDVYTSEVPEDGDINWNNGLFSPYLVVFFGGPIRSARDKGIVSTRFDTTILYCTVEVYAPVADTAAFLKDKVVDVLTGFRPPDCGEMVLEGGLAYSKASNEVRPTQYIDSTAFTTRGNLTMDY